MCQIQRVLYLYLLSVWSIYYATSDPPQLHRQLFHSVLLCWIGTSSTDPPVIVTLYGVNPPFFKRTMNIEQFHRLKWNCSILSLHSFRNHNYFHHDDVHFFYSDVDRKNSFGFILGEESCSWYSCNVSLNLRQIPRTVRNPGFYRKKNYFKNFTHLCCAPFPFFANAVMFWQ